MTGWKRWLLFLSLALALFVLLMSLAATGFYPPLFCGVGNVFFGDMGAGRVARFEPLAQGDGLFDTRVSIGLVLDGAERFPTSLAINSVREGYTPAALLTALALATRMSWRERLRKLGLGLLVIHAFVGLRILVALLYGFSRVGIGERRLLEVGSFGSTVLHRADQILTGDLHLTFLVPLAVWAVLASDAFAQLALPEAPAQDQVRRAEH
jgi:hypothetical protein